MRVECASGLDGRQYTLYKEKEAIGQALLQDGCLACLTVDAAWQGRGKGS